MASCIPGPWERGHRRPHPPWLPVPCRKAQLSQLERSSLSPAVDEGLWRLASARELEGPTSPWTAVSTANTGIAKAVARRSRQGGPRLPGVRGESFPGPAHSSPRGCCKHYHSQVWPGKLLGRANVGSSWGPRGRAGSWRQDSPSPTLRRPHPQDRAQKRVRLWGGFSHTHLPFIQEPALSIHYDLQEASRPLAAPRPPPGKTKPRHQLPEGFRKF